MKTRPAKKLESVKPLTDFQSRVYKAAKLIPKGKVATYQQVAKMAGSPRAFRAVGTCMAHNPDPANIPCHRIVASNGALAGYSLGKGLQTKKALLLKEGVVFNKNQVDLSRSGWNK